MFSEWDYLSSDEAVFFTANEITELGEDCKGIADIRAAIRMSDRMFQARGVPPVERKAAVLASLRKKNEEGLGRKKVEAIREEAERQRGRNIVEKSKPRRSTDGVLP